jgi:transcriptional regulator with XRE-family HTH domain
MSALREELRQDFRNSGKEYRHAYADENLNAIIGTQIKVLREQRELRQGALAREAGMRQPMISRYENVNYSSWSLKTLKKLAWAFDVWLDVRFRPFSDLVTTTDEFGRDSLQVPKFDDDPFFKQEEECTAVAAESKKEQGISNALTPPSNKMLLIDAARSALNPQPKTESAPIAPPQRLCDMNRSETEAIYASAGG